MYSMYFPASRFPSSVELNIEYGKSSESSLEIEMSLGICKLLMNLLSYTGLLHVDPDS